MANTGFHACGTAVNVAGGSQDWLNPTGAQARDVTDLAYSAIPAFSATDYLRCTNFGFSADVPEGATIDGIVVRINRKASLASVINDGALYLWNGSATIGNNKASATYWGTSLADIDYGTGTTDKWGATLTAALIRASTFGVQLIAVNNDESLARTASVDVVEMCVYFTLAAETFELSRSESLSIGSSRSQLMTVNLSVTEGLKGGDALGQSSLMSLLETEGIKLGDSGLATLTALLGVAEGFKAGDSPGVLANMYPSLSEGIKIGDFALLSMLANIQLTDGTKLGDSVLRTILANLQIVEGMKLGDALNLTLSEGIYQLTLNEGIKFGDTEALTALMSLTLADGTRLGDTLLASLPSEVMLALILKLYNRALALKLNERDFNIRLR